MKKLCLIIMDGAGHDTTVSECGFLESLVTAGKARRWKMRCCLPTISAPMYETIHTGLAPQDHGILSNEAIRRSAHPNIFSVAREAGRKTAIVGHSYFHTLYGDGSPFDPYEHAEIDDPAQPVPHARYYSLAGYSRANPCLPSEMDLCAQAHMLARRHQPDYLLLHSSGPDSIGHAYGGNSAEYRMQIWRIDNALSRFVPALQALGYDILVTADHGMNADGHHAGTDPVLTDTAFYWIGDASDAATDDILDQRCIAPTVINRLGLEVPESMQIKLLTKTA